MITNNEGKKERKKVSGKREMRQAAEKNEC
jgi:hypothetical protein